MGSFFSSSRQKSKNQQQGNPQNKPKTISDQKFKSQQMSEQDKVTFDLKKIQDNLNRRIKQMEQNATDCQQKVKEHLINKNKIRAKYALQAKILYEQQIEGILNQDVIITKTIRQVQEKLDQQAISQTLSAANKLMQDVNKMIDIDNMQDAIGNLQELEANNARFDELYNQYVQTDKQEIDNKLNQIEAEIFENDLKQYEIVTQKPKILEVRDQQHQGQQPTIQQKQQMHQEQNVKIQNNIQKDEIDDQLAMLA